jgi:hypothetical protein
LLSLDLDRFLCLSRLLLRLRLLWLELSLPLLLRLLLLLLRELWRRLDRRSVSVAASSALPLACLAKSLICLTSFS